MIDPKLLTAHLVAKFPRTFTVFGGGKTANALVVSVVKEIVDYTGALEREYLRSSAAQSAGLLIDDLYVQLNITSVNDYRSWGDFKRAIRTALGTAGAVEALEDARRLIAQLLSQPVGDPRNAPSMITFEQTLPYGFVAWAQKHKSCSVSSTPDQGTEVLRKALKEIEQLGEKSAADGSNAIRMGNIAHAALIEASCVTSKQRVEE